MLPSVLVLCLAAGGLELGAQPAGTVRAFLVRHGQSFSNLNPAPDLPPEQLDALTDLGRQQSRLAGEALRGQRVRLVLTSPAARARETAAILSELLGVELRVEPRLRPLELGSEGGRTLTWERRIADWKQGRDPQPEHGESLEQLGNRMLALVRSLSAPHAGGGVVLVSHSEAIGAFTGALAGKAPPQRFPPGIDNASISVAEADASEPPRLLLLNHRP